MESREQLIRRAEMRIANPTITVGGVELPCAICHERGCRVYPPCDLARHEAGHARLAYEVTLSGNWMNSYRVRG